MLYMLAQLCNWAIILFFIINILKCLLSDQLSKIQKYSIHNVIKQKKQQINI